MCKMIGQNTHRSGGKCLSVSFISLSMMSSPSITVLQMTGSHLSVVYLNSIPLSIYTTYSFSFHQLVDALNVSISLLL